MSKLLRASVPPWLCGVDVTAAYRPPIHAQTDPKAQSDRAAARIRALQAGIRSARRAGAHGVRRSAQARDRSRDQAGGSRQSRNGAGARHHRARPRRRSASRRSTATRIAETPGVKERLVELSKRGRAGYVQLLLASNDVRAMGRMARGVAAVAELDRVRLETHRRTLAAERDALSELDQQRDDGRRRCKSDARARARRGRSGGRRRATG